MSHRYPTKDEVLADLYEPSRSEEFKLATFGFIFDRWNTKEFPRRLKRMVISALLKGLTEEYDTPFPTIVWGHTNEARRAKREIELIDHSIITALHELGHYLFGDDELRAQQYAVGCYKIINPTLKGLTWKGHLLVARPSSKRKSASSPQSPRRTAASRSKSSRRKAGS